MIRTQVSPTSDGGEECSRSNCCVVCQKGKSPVIYGLSAEFWISFVQFPPLKCVCVCGGVLVEI